MTSTLNTILFIIYLIIGGIPTIYLTISVPVVIIYKLYRWIRYHISIMD